MTSGVLAELAEWAPAGTTVVPLVDGCAQPLCARWSQADLKEAYRLVVEGERAVKCLLKRPGIVFLDEKEWRTEGAPRALADVDSPADLRALGLRPYA
jgi:molybdopterin-guanine dinucleotide biosynthesis protein A